MRLKTKVITSFFEDNGLGINLKKNMAKRSLACIKPIQPESKAWVFYDQKSNRKHGR
jgi:hypothetical protein